MREITDSRLKIFNDCLFENGFIVKTSELTFARINKIGKNWCVWFYTEHYQKNFEKLKEALSFINSEFIKYVRGGI